MNKISSNAVHNFTVRLRNVSEFIDNQRFTDVCKVMSTRLILPLSTDVTILKRVYTCGNDKEEINFKIWFLNTIKECCPPDMRLSFNDSMEMTWCMLLQACHIIY